MMIFVSGGVRSGKSRIAELLVQQMSGHVSRCVYIATSQQVDEEMKYRVLLHRLERERSSLNWFTIERPVNLQEICSMLKKSDIVLLDCATNWLANELFISPYDWEQKAFQQKILEKMQRSILLMKEHVSYIIIVSNELFEGFVLENATFTYMKLLGQFHQWLVSQSDLAMIVEAGKAGIKKGNWPESRKGNSP